MKKILISFIIPSVFLLCGCSKLEPNYMKNENMAEALEKYNEEGIDLFLNQFVDNYNMEYASIALGTDVKPFEMKTTDGEDFNINTMKGKKFVMLIERVNCMSCMDTAPKVYEYFKDSDIEVISIFYRNTPEEIESFYEDLNITKYGITLTSTSEDSKQFLEDYKLSSVPALIFIDENFKIANIHVGSLDDKILDEKIKYAFENDKKLYEYLKDAR